MLTTESYVVAMLVYTLATLLALGLMARFWLQRWPMMARWVVLGVLAGLLLTPALPGPEATTFAPALIIVLFNGLFGAGWESAIPALAVLLAATAAGTLVGVAVALVRRGPKPEQPRTTE